MVKCLLHISADKFRSKWPYKQFGVIAHMPVICIMGNGNKRISGVSSEWNVMEQDSVEIPPSRILAED